MQFGEPETWGMKVGEFLESKEFTLPQQKPQALLDLQEQNRKQRLLDALQKIGPGLMDESLDFIRRENFDGGGRASYTQTQIDEINRLIEDTDLNQSDIAEAVNKKYPKQEPLKPHNVTHYAKKYFGVKNPKKGASAANLLTSAYKKRFSFKDRKGQLVKNILEKEDLVESIKTDVANKLTKQQIVDKYRIGGKGEKLLPSGVKQIGKNTLEKIYEELDIVRGRADLRKVDINTPENRKNLKKIKKFFSDPKLSRAEATEKIGLSRPQIDKLLARYKEQTGKPLIVSRKDLGIQFEGAGQERNVFKQKTKELQKFQSFLKKYKNKPLRSGTVELAKAIKKSGLNPIVFQSNLSLLRKIYKGQERPGFKIDNELKSVIGKFPISTALTGDVLLEAGYTPKQIKKLNYAQQVIRRLDKDQGDFLNQLEHKVPKSVASELLQRGKINKSQYKDIIGRITPVTSDLNQWKKQYDLQRLINLRGYLSSDMGPEDLKKFDKLENNIIKTAKKISGGYDIGRIEINPDGKINLISPDEIFKTKEVEGIGPGSRALINYYKNLKYHNILAKKYNADKGNSAFNTLRSYRKGKDVPLFDESITNDISKLKSSEDFSNYLIKNTDSALFKGLSKLTSPDFRNQLLKAGKVGGTVALATLVPTMLMAASPSDEGLTTEEVMDRKEKMKEEGSLLGDIGAGAGLTTGAAVGSKATQVDPLKGLRRFGKKGAMNLLKLFGTPAGVAAYEAGLIPGFDEGSISKRLEEGDSKEDIFLRSPLTYAGLPLATLGQEFLKARPMLQRALNLGLSPKIVRMGTPVGFGLMGVTGLYDAIKDYQEEFDALSPEEKKAYLKEQEEFGENIQGAAEGGRIGFADGPKDPSKRTFMKIMAGIASLPVVGKFFKAGKPVVEKLANTPTVMPDWFPNFVQKFMNNSIGKKIDADLMEYENPDLPGVKLTRSDDGRVFVEGTNEYNQPYEIQYEPPGYELVDPKTGQSVKTPGNFEAVEGRHVAVGPEDYDVEAYYPEDLDEIAAGDIRAMEKYATGKVSGTVKDTMGKDTGLKKGEYDLNMAEGRAESAADIARDLDD